MPSHIALVPVVRKNPREFMPPTSAARGEVDDVQ